MNARCSVSSQLYVPMPSTLTIWPICEASTCLILERFSLLGGRKTTWLCCGVSFCEISG